MQYFENAVQSDQQETVRFGKIRAEIQAIGGKHILFNNNDNGQFLAISGNWIQAVGTILKATAKPMRN